MCNLGHLSIRHQYSHGHRDPWGGGGILMMDGLSYTCSDVASSHIKSGNNKAPGAPSKSLLPCPCMITFMIHVFGPHSPKNILGQSHIIITATGPSFKTSLYLESIKVLVCGWTCTSLSLLVPWMLLPPSVAAGQISICMDGFSK